MRILHPGKIKICREERKEGEKGFVLLRALITMFIVLFCFAGILFSLSVISRGSSLLREEVYREINQRNEYSRSLLNK